MKLKRLVALMSVSFDQFVNKMEDHEAVAKSVIFEVRKSAAQVRIEHLCAQRRLALLQGERKQMQDEIHTWRQRAKKCLGEHGDEARATQCLQQAASLEKTLDNSETQIAQQEQVLEHLAKSMAKINDQLRDLDSRRALLSSREAQSKVANTLVKDGLQNDLYGVFDRWEQEVVVGEYSHLPLGDDLPEGALTKTFVAEEEGEKLQTQLVELKRELEQEQEFGQALKAEGGRPS